MSLGPRLELRLSQSLVMTPQLQQAIRLLALSNLEVEAFIAEEIERNPLLESGDDGEDKDVPASEETPDAPEDPAGADQLIAEGSGIADAPFDLDADHENLHQDSAADRTNGPDAGSAGAGFSEDGTDFDSFAAPALSLHEHLRAQAGARLNGPALALAESIIAAIEETGWLGEPLGDIARRMGAPRGEAEAILEIVQTFDPAGVGARSLSECLALQAKEANRYDPAMARLLSNLEYLAKGNLAALRRICCVDEEDLADMIAELRRYDPKPGCRFSSGERIDAIVPDLFVRAVGTGFIVELNQATLPRLIVNRAYHAELAAGTQDRASRAWLGECMQSANWLARALDQRARTILKVATQIVERQAGFFRHGVSEMKPLTLRAVAEAISMHESTVSRVTSNKYLSCERGLFELKYFFTSAISSENGESVSAEAVRSRIRILIAAEDPAHILSDDGLVEILKSEGLDIARRTVAKYREAMGLGSSVQRRRNKALGRAA